MCKAGSMVMFVGQPYRIGAKPHLSIANILNMHALDAHLTL